MWSDKYFLYISKFKFPAVAALATHACVIYNMDSSNLAKLFILSGFKSLF